MKKRGISPLVASVILVAIVIILAFFLWFWYNRYIEDLTDKSSINLVTECAQKTEIEIKEFNCDELFDQGAGIFTGNYSLRLDILNTGESRINKLLFKFKSDSNSITKESGKSINPGTSTDIGYIINKNELDDEIPKQIEIIPSISDGKNSRYCEEQSQIVLINNCVPKLI